MYEKELQINLNIKQYYQNRIRPWLDRDAGRRCQCRNLTNKPLIWYKLLALYIYIYIIIFTASNIYWKIWIVIFSKTNIILYYIFLLHYQILKKKFKKKYFSANKLLYLKSKNKKNWKQLQVVGLVLFIFRNTYVELQTTVFMLSLASIKRNKILFYIEKHHMYSVREHHVICFHKSFLIKNTLK
jgi:hypothetical protein